MGDDLKKGLSLDGAQAVTSSQLQPRFTIPALVLFPTEDRGCYEKFRKDMLSELAPEGIRQEIFASRIIMLSWRLQNLHVFRCAQDARKEYVPFLRETLLETLDEYQDFKISLLSDAFMCGEKAVNSPAIQNAEAEPKEDDTADNPLAESAIKAFTDSFKSLLETTKTVFGADAIKAIEENRRNGSTIELAFFADVLTVENYLAELKLAEAIERAIDENVERLRKLKDERRKSQDLTRSRSRFLPPYNSLAASRTSRGMK